jgi:hypothetical protein
MLYDKISELHNYRTKRKQVTLAGKHISYSEWRNWHICPHYHKLTYIDKVAQFEGNIFTAFGKAIHTVCEYTLTSPEKYREPGAIDALVKEQFLKELKALPEEHNTMLKPISNSKSGL